MKGEFGGPKKENSDPLYVASFGKILTVLRAFGRGGQSMGLTELSKETGFSISSVQRFVHTLEKEGLVTRWPSGRRYCLAPSLLELGYHFHQSSGWLTAAWAPLGQLAETLGTAALLWQRDGRDIISLGGCTGPGHVPDPGLWGGRRMPIYCTAGGRMLLAALPREEAKALLDRKALKLLTPKTLVSSGAILKRVETAALLGYAVVDQEVTMGAVSVAATVAGPPGHGPAAVMVELPRRDWPLNRLEEELAPELIATARSLSRLRGAQA